MNLKDNLIYMPCDIDVPNIDVSKIKAWSWHTDTIKDIHSLYVTYNPDAPQDFSEFYNVYTSSMLSGVYWQDHFAVHSLSHRRHCDTGHGRYINEFDKHFPEIIELFSELPTLGTTWRLGWLYYNDEHKDQYTSSPIHIDETYNPDFRLVLNQTDPELSFYPWQDDIYDNIVSDPNYLNNIMMTEQRGLAQKFSEDLETYDTDVPNTKYVKSDPLYATFEKPNHVYMLNSRTAAHRGKYINTSDAQNKLTFLCWKSMPFKPELPFSEQFDVHRLNDLVDRSITKYSEHIITRDGTHDIHC